MEALSEVDRNKGSPNNCKSALEASLYSVRTSSFSCELHTHNDTRRSDKPLESLRMKHKKDTFWWHSWLCHKYETKNIPDLSVLFKDLLSSGEDRDSVFQDFARQLHSGGYQLLRQTPAFDRTPKTRWLPVGLLSCTWRCLFHPIDWRHLAHYYGSSSRKEGNLKMSIHKGGAGGNFSLNPYVTVF